MKHYLLFWLFVVATLLVTAACGVREVTVVVTPTPVATPSALDVLNEYLRAFNAGDVEALTRVLSDDVVVSFGPLTPQGHLVTRNGMAEVLENYLQNLDNRGEFAISDVQEVESEVTARFTFSSKGLKTIGIEHLNGTLETVVEGGRIRRMTATPDESSLQSLSRFFQSSDQSGPLMDVSDKLNFPRVGLGGAAWLDYDNDGFLDLFITNERGLPNALFRNEGDGSFAEVAEAAGVANGLGNAGVVAGDIDNDGCVDLFLTGAGGMSDVQSPNKLYLNNCDGTFSDITDAANVPGSATSLSAAFGDINNDGFLDLFVTSPGSLAAKEQHRNRLYLNNGDRTFTDISKSAGVDTALGACAVLFSDYNRDGLADIFVANCNNVDFQPTPFELFLNNGDLTFTEVASRTGLGGGGFWMGAALGDYDNDGDLDLFATNASSGMPDLGGAPLFFPHALYENLGDGTYVEVGAAAGLTQWEFGWGVSFADFDNDGDVDLFFAGSLPTAPFNVVGPGKGNPGRLLLNNGDKTFSPAAAYGLENQFTSGVAAGDFNNDGFADVVVVSGSYDERPSQPLLLQNQGNGNSWITVKTVGTRSNRDGVGALVRVTAGDLQQIQEVRAGSSFLSMDSPWLTFGLNDHDLVDIEVSWPSGLVEQFPGQAARQTVTLVEGTGTPK